MELVEMDSIKFITRFTGHKLGKSEYQQELKLVVLGDPGVGKRCLTNTYLTNKFQPDRNKCGGNGPKEIQVTLNGDRYGLHIWDSFKMEYLGKINREPKVDCFILCYAVNNVSSFASIKSKWLPKLNASFPTVPIILVATKSDTEPKVETILEKQVVSLEGKLISQQIRSFMRCSSKTMEGLEHVFVEAIHASTKSLLKGSQCAIS